MRQSGSGTMDYAIVKQAVEKRSNIVFLLHHLFGYHYDIGSLFDAEFPQHIDSSY